MITSVFAGELMTCTLCGKKETSDPGIESQWRALELDGVRYYACPDEFPLDTGNRAEFGAAYTRVFAKILLDRAEAAGSDVGDLRQKFKELNERWENRQRLIGPVGKRRLKHRRQRGR